MLHDILLACLNTKADRLSVEEIFDSDAVSHLFHPCEKPLFKEIIRIMDLLRDLVQFTKAYGDGSMTTSGPSVTTIDTENLPHGLYLNSFAIGVESVVQEFYQHISEMEEYILNNPKHSLVYTYERLQAHLPLLQFLRKLVLGIKTKKLHGCMILESLYQHVKHGNENLELALMKIMKPVKLVFISQLTSWMLYGKLEDNYAEFFIQCSLSPPPPESSIIEKGTSTSSLDTIHSSEGIWQYELNMLRLPRILSANWAEKVLFIGQTVLVFQMDMHKDKRHKFNWGSSSQTDTSGDSELWKEQEFQFYKQLITLANADDFNIYRLETVTNEIKKYVTLRLSEIALNDVALKHQMMLIKDFYLLGRGELFLEFLRQLYSNQGDYKDDFKLTNCLRAFELAANAIGLSDDLNNFTLSLLHPIEDIDSNSDFDILYLKYRIVWPLNLMFSPKAIDRYNVIFRFLLLLRKLQYELHIVWRNNLYDDKSKAWTDIKVINLRNQLMFFIDHFQYYIQIDVLESQFSILLNVINSNVDFEEIQRAHSVFQANVLSQCFLLTEENANLTKSTNSTKYKEPTQNPVCCTLNDLFQLCEEFAEIFQKELTETTLILEIDKMEKRFKVLIVHLMKLLVSIRTSASVSTSPLSQLLLRLDYNHWFSTNISSDNDGK